MLTILRKLNRTPKSSMSNARATLAITNLLAFYPDEEGGNSEEFKQAQKKRKAVYSARAQEKVKRRKTLADERLQQYIQTHEYELDDVGCEEPVFLGFDDFFANKSKAVQLDKWGTCDKPAVYRDNWNGDNTPLCRYHAALTISNDIEIKENQLETALPEPMEITERTQCMCWCTQARNLTMKDAAPGDKYTPVYYRCKQVAKAFGMCLAHANKPMGVYLARARVLIVHEIRPTGIKGVDRIIAAYFQEGANVFSKVQL